MTNTLRSPTVASHPTMCACRQTNANLPLEKKRAMSYFRVRWWCNLRWFQEKKASRSFRARWPVHPVIKPGEWLTGWHTGWVYL